MDTIWTLVYILMILTAIFAGLVSTNENLPLKQRHRAKYVTIILFAIILFLCAWSLLKRRTHDRSHLVRSKQATSTVYSKDSSVPLPSTLISPHTGQSDYVLSPFREMSQVYPMNNDPPLAPSLMTSSMPFSMQSTLSEDSILPSIFLDFGSPTR